MSVSSASRVAPARACAYAVVRRVAEQDAWADRALIAEARRRELDPRDRALAMQLAYGTVQRASTLDHLIERLAGRPADGLDAPVRASLRLGLYQLAYLERIPPHAAVSEGVELVKQDAPRASGLVNAVLRRGVKEAGAIVAKLPERTPAQAALKHAHPLWIAERWWRQLGPEGARALMAAGNVAPEAAIRVNPLRPGDPDAAAPGVDPLGPGDPDNATPGVDKLLAGDADAAALAAAIAAELPVPSHTDAQLPEALVLDGPFDVHASSQQADGRVMAQSRAAQAVARVVDPRPGERVLDLCAAPGGKTTHLAALMGATGSVVAVERDPTRARGLRATVERMHAAGCVEIRVIDARQVDEPQAYDRVLVDPPCSDLGTLAARPDARWRKSPDDVARLVKLQRQLLEAGARATRPGGTLVYSTCTISPAENEEQVQAFLDAFPLWSLDDLGADHAPTWQHPSVPACSQSLPHRDGTDGFFVARLRRGA